MRNHQLRCGRYPRLLLFLAGLLYLLGTAAEPMLHPASLGGGGMAALMTDASSDDGEPTPAAPHEEGGCLLCKVVTPITLTAALGSGVVPVSADRDVRLTAGGSRAPPAATHAQPRAPPLL
jgi:hypothetical protein